MLAGGQTIRKLDGKHNMHAVDEFSHFMHALLL